MPNKPYKSEVKTSLHSSVDRAVKGGLEALAQVRGCSVSQLTNEILKKAVDEYSPEWEKPGPK
jgi:hypothetical protein